jgi:hypothetical protein
MSDISKGEFMARSDQNQALMVEMYALLNRIETALVVRDPGTKVSADAYDGLRKMLLQSSKNRRIHVSHLLSLSDSLNRDASMQLIRDRVGDFMAELGVSYWSDTSQADLFDVIEGEGTVLECVEPAVVERLEDGRIVEVRRGTARRVQGPEPEAPNVDSDADTTSDSPSVSDAATPSASEELAVATPAESVNGRKRSVVPFVLASLVIGFIVGLMMNPGSNDSPKESTTTTSIAATTTTVPPTTTTTEAGQ